MDPETEVVPAPEPKPETESLPERMAKSVEQQWPVAAEDSNAADTPVAEEPPVAEPVGTVEAVEPAPEAPVQEPPSDDTPFTAEQLKDKSFWGRLDKAGWEKAERLHPVETHLVKAAQAAASKIVNEARNPKADPQPPQPTEVEPELDAKTQELLLSMESIDPKERAKALKAFVADVIAETPEVKATRNGQQRQTILAQAESLAIGGSEEHGLPAMPELSRLDTAELDAAFESDPEAKVLASMGTPLSIAMAMRKAGQTVLAKKSAAETKRQAEQDKLRRNANTPPSNAVQPGAGGPVPKGRPTVSDHVLAKWGEVARKAS